MKAKVGDRIEVYGILPNDPDPITVGTRGTVTSVDKIGDAFVQYGIDWDTDRYLMLLDTDPFRVVNDE